MDKNQANDRIEELKEMLSLIKFRLLGFNIQGNNEKIDVSCQNNHVQSIDSFMLINNLKKGICCPECDAESQSEVNFDPEYYLLYKSKQRYTMTKDKEKIAREIDKKLKEQEKNFLISEKKQVMNFIIKNRKGSIFGNPNDNLDYIIRCHNSHLFSLNYRDIISGKWCEFCKETHIQEQYFHVIAPKKEN